MILSRWFFRWTDKENIEKYLEAKMLRAALEGTRLVRNRDLVAVVLERSLWHRGVGTWTRNGLRGTLPSILKVKDPGCARRDTTLVWSNNDIYFGEPARTMLQGFPQVEEEAGLVWAWIAHYLSKPITWQRTTTLADGEAELLRWLKTSNTVLP